MSQAHSGLGPRWSPSPSLPHLHTPARRERAREPYALLDTTGLDGTIQASHDDVRHHELECDSLHVDSDYVATTADGHTWCDNHWKHIFPQLQREREHSCPGNRDLYAEPWFAVDQTAQQSTCCSSCCLIH